MTRILSTLSIIGAIAAVGLILAALTSGAEAQGADGPIQRITEVVSECTEVPDGPKTCVSIGATVTEIQEVDGTVEVRSFDMNGKLTEIRPATQDETDAYNTFKAGQDAEAEQATADAVISDWQDTAAPQDAQRLADCQSQWTLLDPLGKDACMQDVLGITLRLMGVTDIGLDQKVDVTVVVATETPVLPTATVSVPTVGISAGK